MLVLSLLLPLAGCESKDAENEATDQNSETAQEEQSTSDANAAGDTLVVYFSATGTTKGVAETIAKVTGADIHEIVPAQKYTDADLDWNDKESRTTKEQNDPSVRPEIASDTIDLSKYSTIYIGYPIWWGEEPRIMDTFVEANDFGNANVIPFCTSGGSGIGNSGKNLEKNAGSGKWIDGDRLNGGTSEDEIQDWINGLGLQNNSNNQI